MSVSSADYRNAISRFLTGITVVTTRHAGLAQGITASAVCSVTLEPPTLLVCLNRLSATCQAVSDSGRFCVNILAEDQLPIAKLFSSRSADKFAELATIAAAGHTDSAHGVPVLHGTIAHLECRVSDLTDVGTHRIFFGEVIEVAASYKGAPLAYFRGQFAGLGRAG